MQRIGFYPGTFDPIHDGHIAFALESLEACELDAVVFLPESSPRNKVNVPSIISRIEQIKLVTDSHQRLQVRSLESHQFTIRETLSEIQNLFSNAHLTMLAGSDVALNLCEWKEIKVLLSACDIAVGMRSKQTEAEIADIITRLKSLHPPLQATLIHTARSSLASSTLRNK